MGGSRKVSEYKKSSFWHPGETPMKLKENAISLGRQNKTRGFQSCTIVPTYGAGRAGGFCGFR